MKSKIVSTRFKISDIEKLEAKCLNLGVSVSQYIRETAKKGHIVQKVTLDPRGVRAVYNGLNNLNQAVKLAHIAANKEQGNYELIERLNSLIDIVDATRAELIKFMKEFR